MLTVALLGPENLTLLQITSILSKVLDCPIAYVQVTIESIQQQMASFGATPDVQKEACRVRQLDRLLGKGNAAG